MILIGTVYNISLYTVTDQDIISLYLMHVDQRQETVTVTVKGWTLQTTPSKTIRTTPVSALFIDNLAVVLGFLTFQDNIIYVHYQKVTNSFAFAAKRGRKPRLFLKLI